VTSLFYIPVSTPSRQVVNATTCLSLPQPAIKGLAG